MSHKSFESLENRQLFAVAVAFIAPDTLTFTGNAANDAIYITDNGAGGISGSATNAAGVLAPFPAFAGIRKVFIQTNAGNDYVSYQITNDLAPAGHQLTVDLGAGNDILKVSAGADIDISGQSYLQMKLTGNMGDDIMKVFYRGEMDGRFDMTIDGNDGHDRLSTEANFDPGSAGSFVNRTWGSLGDDTMDLLVRKVAGDPIGISAIASGGAGIDSVTRTAWAAHDATTEFWSIVP